VQSSRKRYDSKWSVEGKCPEYSSLKKSFKKDAR
jgi:hypothetical protein